MTGSRKYSNSKFLLSNKRAKAIFIQGFSAQEAKNILLRLVDILRVVFEMYYIRFKIQEIRDNVHAFTENKKGRIFSFIRNISSRQASLETSYITNTSTDLAS